MKKFRKDQIKNILVVSLSNIGDVILTCPVIDILKQDFPQARISIVVGPKAAPLFDANPNIHRVVVYHKKEMKKPGPALKMVWTLRKEKFDLAVDLRGTALPLLIGARYRTPLPITRIKFTLMRWQHLNRLKKVYQYPQEATGRTAIVRTDENRRFIRQLLRDKGVDDGAFIMVSPGAADEKKRWPAEHFAAVCDAMMERASLPVVFVGDGGQDRAVVEKIISLMRRPAVDLTGQTSLTQLACLFEHSCFALVNDSAAMHMASYFDVPVLALFGPTDPRVYGPWSRRSFYLKKGDMIGSITIDDVLSSVEINRQGVAFKERNRDPIV